MALSLSPTLIDNFGESVTIQNAYVKVIHVLATKDILTVFYAIMRSANEQSICTKTVDTALDLEGPNPIKQAYQFLKSLPEFSDATDC